MNIRETTIAKLEQFPESLLQEVDNVTDFLAHKHQSRKANSESRSNEVMLMTLEQDGLSPGII